MRNSSKKCSDEEFVEIIKKSFSITQVLNHLKLKAAGGNFYTIKRRINSLNIDTTHFLGQGHLKGKTHNWSKSVPLKDVLILDSPYGGGSMKLKQRLIKEGLLENKCYKCGLTNWLEQPISLELEHINGNHFDNRIENLTILCPNCHSQTSTFRGRNKKLKNKNGLKKYYCSNCNKEISRGSDSGLCSSCFNKTRHYSVNNRKVKNRPSKEQLLKDIEEMQNYCAVGRKYGVTDNSIRKWLRS